MPALVLGARTTALGVIRTLSRAHIPNYLVSRAPGFLVWSRWYRTFPAGGQNAPEPGGLENWLRALPLKSAVLLPCADDWVWHVAALSPVLRERFPSSVSEPAAIASLVDKGRFANLVRELQIPHPRTILIDSSEQVESLPDGDLGDFFLKPRNSQEFSARYGFKAFRPRDRGSLRRFVRDASEHGIPLMLQEYIPGPPTAHWFVDGFIDRSGAVLAMFARHRLRMYPSDFGNSSLHVSVPISEVRPAADALGTLLRDLKYRGIFSAEFKYDARDRQFKILEVNARPWWYIDFAARSGVDVCRLAYRDALQLPCKPVDTYLTGRRCVTLDLDWKAYFELRRAGQISFWHWVHSCCGSDHPVFSWSDPGPALHMLIDIARGRWRRNPPAVQRMPDPDPFAPGRLCRSEVVGAVTISDQVSPRDVQ